MKYYRLKQGGSFKEPGSDRFQWFEPKSMNEPGGLEFNLSHGLAEEILEEQSNQCVWGSGNYRENEDGTFTCVKANWDSSG